jgi:putative pyruvate formate lyase activating enzyme
MSGAAVPSFDPTRPCRLCPRACNAVRGQEAGLCGAGAAVRVALAQLHPGEEPFLSGPQPGPGGSGAIFFSGCALRCVYCQNHEISFGPTGPNVSGQALPGHDCSVDDLTALMLELQLCGAHNINLVTAAHYTPQVRAALIQARANGLRLPVVWNTSAYETVDALLSLEGLVDIYLPDLRYMDTHAAARYSAAPDYPRIATHAILEMQRQVGGLVIDERTGLATRGLAVRLLLLPEDAGRVDLALAWIADTLGAGTAVSLMGQYYPAHRAAHHPEINRGVTRAEYAAARRTLEELGFWRGCVQEVGSSADWTPDFRQK